MQSSWESGAGRADIRVVRDNVSAGPDAEFDIVVKAVAVAVAVVVVVDTAVVADTGFDASVSSMSSER